MSLIERPDAITAAQKFVKRHFPTCSVALLAGSVVRGKEHAGSDLDIVIIADDDTPNWGTFEEFGWPIEVFVRTPDTYTTAFANEVQQRWPLFISLCNEGAILYDYDGLASILKNEAKRVFDEGPAPLTAGEISWYRYLLTWMIDDVNDASDVTEGYIMAHELAATAAEFLLLHHRQWLGRGKWLIRNLRQTLPLEAEALTQALANFYQKNDKAPLLRFSESTLSLVGGRQFAGHSANL